MRRTIAVPLALLLAAGACTKGEGSKPAAPGTPAASPAPAGQGWTAKAAAGKELFASMDTTQGTVVLRLFSKDAPETVKNFVGLATGEREWQDPRTGELVRGRSLYAGTVFHRVIPGFMIQGGDPLGNGTGTPGYSFVDEFQSGRTFDKPGLLAMANAGPNTNGSQFFITVSTPHHLDNRHTIFGEVVKGYEVVTAIVTAPRGSVKINGITLSETQP